MGSARSWHTSAITHSSAPHRFAPLVALLLALSCEGRTHRGQEPASAVTFAPSGSPIAPPPSALAAPSAPASARPPPPFTGTAGIVEVKREIPPSVLTAIRAATHDGYDRVVFEFRGPLPGYHVEYIDRPVRDCGAGEPRPIAGDGWLEVRFFPANNHEEDGRPTIAERELRPNLVNVVEIERTCDFEAVVTWVLGTRSPNHYRVLELDDPPRFVLDVRHDRRK